MRRLILSAAASVLALGVAGCAAPGASYNNKDHVARTTTSSDRYVATTTYNDPYRGTRYVYVDRQPVVQEQVVTRTYTYPVQGYVYAPTTRTYVAPNYRTVVPSYTYANPSEGDRYGNDEDPQVRQVIFRDLVRQGYSDFDDVDSRGSVYLVRARDDLNRPVILTVDRSSGAVVDVDYL